MRNCFPLAGLCLAVFLAMSGMGLAGVALPEKYLQTAGTLRSAGWLASSFALAYVFCQYPAGWLADRFGYRYILSTGFLFMALAAVVYHVSQNPLHIYCGRFLQGVGEAPVWACAPAYLGKIYSCTRGRAIGWYNAAFHLGMMIAPLVVLLGYSFSALAPFMVFAGLCTAAMLLTLLVVAPADRTPSDQKTAARVYRGWDSSCWPLVAAIVLFGAFYGLSTSSLPVYLAAGKAGANINVAQFYLSLFGGITLAQYVSGRLSDLFGRSLFVIGGLLGCGLGLMGLFASSFFMAVSSIVVMGAGMGTFAVASLALINERSGSGRQGRASGLYYLAWGIGYCLGPFFANGQDLIIVSKYCALASLMVSLVLLRRN